MRECVHSQLAQRIARNTAIMHLIAMPLPHNHTLFGGKRMARNTALMQFDCNMVVIYTMILWLIKIQLTNFPVATLCFWANISCFTRTLLALLWYCPSAWLLIARNNNVFIGSYIATATSHSKDDEAMNNEIMEIKNNDVVFIISYTTTSSLIFICNMHCYTPDRGQTSKHMLKRKLSYNISGMHFFSHYLATYF